MAKGEYLTAEFSIGSQAVVAGLSVTLDAPVGEVWDALTSPERLPKWLAPGRIDLRVGGVIRLEFAEGGVVIDSTVTEIDPPRVLAYSWSGPGAPRRPVRWVLEPIGQTTHLTLKLCIPASEDAARAVAGWAAHLEMLSAALAGAPIRFPLQAFTAARAAYAGQLAQLARRQFVVPAA